MPIELDHGFLLIADCGAPAEARGLVCQWAEPVTQFLPYDRQSGSYPVQKSLDKGEGSRHHAESLFGGASRSTNHRYGLTSDHDSSMRTSRRRRAGAKVEDIFPLSKARFLRRLLYRPSGCESAQSVLRSSFRRPGLLPGYSRCERFPDKLCSCAASRKVVRTTCALPPLWQLLSPSGDNGAGTACETLRPNA